MLQQFHDHKSIKISTVLCDDAVLTPDLQLSEALRIKSETSFLEHDDVYLFVDSKDKTTEKGRIEKFIWDLWEATDLEEDELNYSLIENKAIHNYILTSISETAVQHLIFFLYNGKFPDVSNFGALLELNNRISVLNLDRKVHEAVKFKLDWATSHDDIRKAWQNEDIDPKDKSVLINLTIAYIICNPENVFLGSEAWNDIPKLVLEKLGPESLSTMMEELKEYGATTDKRKTYSKADKTYIQMSHFDLFYFLVQWAKNIYVTAMNPDANIYQVPTINRLRMVLGSTIELVDPTNFDVSKFNGDPSIPDAKTFIMYLNAYISLRNLAIGSGVDADAIWNEDFDLPMKYIQGVPEPVNKKPRLVKSSPARDESLLAIEGRNTTLTVDRLYCLFNSKRLADVIMYLDNGSSQLHLHSYVFRLRKSIFTHHFNSDDNDVKVFDFGAVTLDSASNFFKSFYVEKNELRNHVEINLEFCFLALLLRVDFLLDTVFMFTRDNKNCNESRVLHFVSAHRRSNDKTKTNRRLKALAMELQSDLLQITETASFKYLFDEHMIQEVFRGYESGGIGFYYNVISRLESMSLVQVWLRNEGMEQHKERMKLWKTNGVIRLDKVSKEEIKKLTRQGFLDMDDAIEYSYAIGCKVKS